MIRTTINVDLNFTEGLTEETLRRVFKELTSIVVSQNDREGDWKVSINLAKNKEN